MLTDICQKSNKKTQTKKSPALQSQVAEMFLYLTEFIDHQQPTVHTSEVLMESVFIIEFKNLQYSAKWKVVKGFPMTTEKLVN